MSSESIYSREETSARFKEYIIHDEHHLSKYLDLIEHISNNPPQGYSERHHILPRSLFPELKRDKRNIVRCSAYDHFVLHYHLAKFTKNRQMIFALNNMNRVKKIVSDECLDDMAKKYLEFKEELSNIISETNRGRQYTLEQRTKMGAHGKNMVVVYDIDDPEKTTFRVSKEDPKYISGQYVFYRVGTSQKAETKKKISDQNLAANRGNLYTHKITNESEYFISKPDENWVLGADSDFKKKCKERFLGNVFWINTKTRDVKRSHDCPGEDWVLGGKFEKTKNPFSGNKIMYNVNTKETSLKPFDFAEPFWVYNGKHVYCFEYFGKTYIHGDKKVVASVLGVPHDKVKLIAYNCVNKPKNKIKNLKSWGFPYTASLSDTVYGDFKIRTIDPKKEDVTSYLWYDPSSC